MKRVCSSCFLAYSIPSSNLSQEIDSPNELINKHHVSTGTLDALRKGRSVTLNTLHDLCEILNCNIQDIVTFTKDK